MPDCQLTGSKVRKEVWRSVLNSLMSAPCFQYGIPTFNMPMLYFPEDTRLVNGEGTDS